MRSACVAHARGNAIDCDQQSISKTLVLGVPPQPLQNLHLQDVDRVNVGIAHVDQRPQHLVVLVQPVVSCQLHTHTQTVTFTMISRQCRMEICIAERSGKCVTDVERCSACSDASRSTRCSAIWFRAGHISTTIVVLEYVLIVGDKEGNAVRVCKGLVWRFLCSTCHTSSCGLMQRVEMCIY